MISDRITVSLKAAEVATMALEGIESCRASFPGLQCTMNASLALVNDAVSNMLELAAERHSLARGVNGTNGHSILPEEPVQLAQALDDYPEDDPWDPESPRDVNRCKALMLEILRRAAHDWVLYRQHSQMKMRELAEDAYIWLFEEDEGHPYRRQRLMAIVELSDGRRVQGARIFTSFMAICDSLDLDPEVVRARVRKMDIQTIISSGRPAETRKLKTTEVSPVESCGVMVDVDVDAMPTTDYVSKYESYGTVSTPSELRPAF